MIFTSQSPNTELDDVTLAARLRFFSSVRNSSKNLFARSELEKTLAFHSGIPDTFAFDSGRTSLYAILEALDLSPEDQVLLQAYTCVAVPEPILWVGSQPVYVDVLDDFTMDPKDLEKKITPKSKVLIIQHTFGTPAHMDELLAIAAKHKLFIIEDCAHALGATYKGSRVGTFGDASFWSFGRDKVISSVFGGVAAVKNPEVAKRVRAVYNSFPESSLPWVKKQLNHPIIFSIAKPLYQFYIGKVIIEATKRFGLFSKAVEQVELSGGKPSFAFHKMSNALAVLALQQFGKLERFNAHRKEIAMIYAEALKTSLREGIYLRYTTLVPSPLALSRKMKKEKIEIGDWYDTPIAPKNVQYEKIQFDPKSCPNAMFLSLKTINLPTHIQISRKDAQRVAEVFLKNIQDGSTGN